LLRLLEPLYFRKFGAGVFGVDADFAALFETDGEGFFDGGVADLEAAFSVIEVDGDEFIQATTMAPSPANPKRYRETRAQSWSKSQGAGNSDQGALTSSTT
jgi:hypothetical protein